MSAIPMLSQLESFLHLAGMRQQAIAANMANIDTPGYRTQGIDFQGELKRALHDSAAGLSTAALHGPVVRAVRGLIERPDGNNVSLDREGMLMAETQLQYQAGVQLLKMQFHELISAINGGGGQ